MRLLLVALDLAGTFVFALSGAAAGVARRLDLFGVLVVAAIAATAGGIMRDVLIGVTPPASLADWRYIAVCIAAGLITFRYHRAVERMRSPVLIFDAAGLALFAVSGTLTAIAHRLNPLSAALLGMLTGVGGGMARDIVLAEVPGVMRSELYAVAALAGAAVVVAAHMLRLPAAPAAGVGVAACFGLRLMAIRRGWGLPVAEPR